MKIDIRLKIFDDEAYCNNSHNKCSYLSFRLGAMLESMPICLIHGDYLKTEALIIYAKCPKCKAAYKKEKEKKNETTKKI